jgi:VanZ family protein
LSFSKDAKQHIIKEVGRAFKYWGPPVLWAAVIFVISAYPTTQTSQIYWKDFIVKKSGHVIEYGVFAALIYRAFRNSGAKRENAGIYAILIALLYGVTDEFHQSYTPGREPRVRDVVFDTIGAIATIYSIWNLLPKAPERLKRLARALQLI